MTKTKQTIYKTAGGCYHVGKRYFQYLDAALKESTREECMLNHENQEDRDDRDTDLYRVDSEDFADAVLTLQARARAKNSDVYRVDTDMLNGVLRDIARGAL